MSVADGGSQIKRQRAYLSTVGSRQGGGGSKFYLFKARVISRAFSLLTLNALPTAHCLLPTALRRLAFGRLVRARRLRNFRVHRFRRLLLGLKIILLIVSGFVWLRSAIGSCLFRPHLL